MNSIIEAQQELENCRLDFVSEQLTFNWKDCYTDFNPNKEAWVEKLDKPFSSYLEASDESNLIKTSCICGDSFRSYYIMTTEVQEDLNNPCPYCGTTLNEDNYNRLQKVEKATSWIQKLRNKLMKLLIKLISFRF